MKTRLLLIMIFFPAVIFGKDVLTLNNQTTFEGKVVKIDQCMVTFVFERERYHIPAQDIYSIEFDDPNDKVYTSYMEHLLYGDGENCLKGQYDGKYLHGKGLFHFGMGLLFGPFAMVGAAIASPTPDNSTKTMVQSLNKDLFNNPEYLKCYKKKAKWENIGNTAWGWSTWLLMFTLFI